jgi:DNA-binding NtrC family response regulator
VPTWALAGVCYGGQAGPGDTASWDASALLVGHSALMCGVRDRLHELAPLPWPVRIEGPTGSGKGLAARVLHELSPRAQGPFIRQSVTTLAQGVEFGRLFGWSRGGFTGAARDTPGAAESAHGGTLFLDEIDSAGPYVQGGLLQLLEDGEVLRIGEQRPRKLDVRFVFATKVDLEAAVAAGTFRGDLFYRLGSLVVSLPALRDRLEDIPELAAVILARLAGELGRPAPRLSDPDLDQLCRYSWPGNVRQLESAMRSYLASGVLADAVAGGRAEVERVREALERHAWNKTRAARALGIARQTLHAKIRAYDLDDAPRTS